tara:strand:- start:263 stop:658 length:396 start_codon:yes stop_codon:yes gene_type:complete
MRETKSLRDIKFGLPTAKEEYETAVIGEAINKAIEQVAIVVKAAEVAQVAHEEWEQLEEFAREEAHPLEDIYSLPEEELTPAVATAIDAAEEVAEEASEREAISSMSNPRLLELAELAKSLLLLIDKYQTR